MKHLILIIGAVFGLQLAFAEELVIDPIADFSQLAHDPAEKLLKLEVDLNHTGRKAIFLSRTNLWAGKSGNAWTVYIPTGTTYQRVDRTDSGDPITFRPDRYFIGRLPGGKGGEMLLTYAPGGGGKGALLGYQIVDGKVHEILVKEEFEPGGADKETYGKTLGSHFTRSVQKLDFPK